MIAAPAKQAPYAGLYQPPPQMTEPAGTKTWLTRGANFVVALSKVTDAAVLARADNPDEYMVLLSPGVSASIRAGDASIEAPAESLTIVPPGRSSVATKGAGYVARVFSSRASDLASSAANAALYAQGAAEVAPLAPWPDPPGGFRLRNYVLREYENPKLFGRLFRSSNLMINIFDRKTVRRDPRQLSPHSHADFEQASLTLEGKFVHHLRVPWTANRETWKEDEHVEFDSPSVLIIPAGVIHTTQDVGEGITWLIDIFAPPRMDFSLKPELVRNEAEYPMPVKS